MRILTVLSVMFISVLGCAVLNQPTFEIDSSRLTSQTNPKFVDGNVDTISTFEVKGHIEKSYKNIPVAGRTRGERQRMYLTQGQGYRRTEAVIKLDVPTYISYIEIYPASRIPNLSVTSTMEDPPRFKSSFVMAQGKQHVNVEGKLPVRFEINREILYLRLSADAIEDKQGAVREKRDRNVKKDKNTKINRDERIQIPLKGASIREVKFYAR
ncbi:MAG: hypothetical protein OXI67_21365 [Candidatus Poribacteria bacterium]|nr:hypothetical protein [Candidatus Poribacteria bacterium]